jgi:SPP1 family predicted phage head-tail adaptor
MRSGRLRHKCLIEQSTETPNEFGEPITTWKAFASAWMSIEPIKGNEFFSALHVQSEIDSKIVLRWSCKIENMTDKFRIVFNGKIYDIKSVINVDERNKEIHVMARRHL